MEPVIFIITNEIMGNKIIASSIHLNHLRILFTRLCMFNRFKDYWRLDIINPLACFLTSIFSYQQWSKCNATRNFLLPEQAEEMCDEHIIINESNTFVIVFDGNWLNGHSGYMGSFERSWSKWECIRSGGCSSFGKNQN